MASAAHIRFVLRLRHPDWPAPPHPMLPRTPRFLRDGTPRLLAQDSGKAKHGVLRRAALLLGDHTITLVVRAAYFERA